MIIGILSDTHGHVPRTTVACSLLKLHGAGLVLHCGDIGSERVLIELAGQFGDTTTPVHAVTGNVDQWEPSVLAFPGGAGVEVHGTRFELEADGKRIAMLHGHEAGRLQAAIDSGDYHYVLTGHTHRREDRHVGSTRIINPGAVYRTAEPTVAILDTALDTVRFCGLRDTREA
jgi:putative phosphoesterase